MSALHNTASLGPFLPELVLMGGVLALVLASMLVRRPARHVAAGLTALTCVAGAVATFATRTTEPKSLFFGLLARDPFGDYFKYLSFTATALIGLLVLRARDSVDYQRRDADACEFYGLVLAAALGVNLMAAATDLLTAYLALEFVSLMSYLLAGFSRGSRRSAEASLKYVIYGGVASGAMLYGLSLLYGLAAATDLTTVRLAAQQAPGAVVLVAAVLTMAGLGYKIAVVPFHMWCPDVYQGAPTPVSAFLSVAPKAGGFALVLRFLGTTAPGQVSSDSPWVLFLLVVAVATMTVGNLAALGQHNLKRLLAYSSIAHAGYALLGVAVGGPAGQHAVLFYLAVYLFMNIAAFGVVLAVADRGGGETLDDYAGLGFRMPLPALVLAVTLIALTGLPPTAGFIGKYYLFAALIERGQGAGGATFYLVALIGVLNSVVSLYYYARVLRAMYLQRARVATGPTRAWGVHTLVLGLTSVPTVVLGIYWAPLRDFVESAVTRWGA
jgi:NADH-quinone oxidoreductase subunit N